MLNARGEVLSVGSSSAALFGFDPRLLVGKSVAAFLDVFRSCGEGAPPAGAL